MYHILAAKCHGQDSARLGEYHPLALASADAPRLVERATAVVASVGRVEEKVHFAGAGGGFDAFGAIDEVAGARFHAEPVERVLAKCGFGALAEIGGYGHVGGLEGALEGRLELALGVRGIELGASDADPRAAARRSGAYVGRDASVRAEGEPDQLILRALAARQDAGALGLMPLSDIVRPERSRRAPFDFGLRPALRTSGFSEA
jgi:hypothetical protein